MANAYNVLICSPAGFLQQQRLCLSVDPADGSSLIVAARDPDSALQHWIVMDLGNSNFAFWNDPLHVLVADMGTGALSLRYKPAGPGAPYATDEFWNGALNQSLADFIKNTLVQFGQGVAGLFTGATHIHWPGIAVRPNFDYNRNLNILGDGPWAPGRRVAAWDGWGGGDPNELWWLESRPASP